MDTHEIDIKEYIEYLESESRFVRSTPVVPPWEIKRHNRVWSPFVREYHNVIDNPRKLPTLLQPIISKERAFTFGHAYPSYLNFKVYVPDEYGVHRRLYINLCQENFVVGATGALIIGLGTKSFTMSQSALHSFVAQRLLLGKPVAAITRMALTGSVLTATLCAKVVTRAVGGGVFYDMLKRSREDKHMDKLKMITNAGVAGGISGFLFGFRGSLSSLPQAWIAGMLMCVGSMASEFVTIPKIFSTHADD